MRILDYLFLEAFSGARWYARSPGGAIGLSLLIFVLVVNESLKTITFSYEKLSLAINRYLKNHAHENPRRNFFSRLFRERGGMLDLREKL